MEKRFLLIIIFTHIILPIMAYGVKYDKNHILYADETAHLRYMLNTDTKEAMLGDGIDEKKNAIELPKTGDDWYQNPVNYWKDIVIPNSVEYNGITYVVTKVASNAFYKCTDVYTITLPETIKEIGNYAFGFCTNLKSINIPEGTTAIPPYAFYVCQNLESMHLPSSIETIGTNAFIDCVKLESINIPGKCNSIGNDAFSWCLKLSSVTFEDGDTPIKLGYAYSFGPMWEAYKEPFYYPSTFYRGLFNDCELRHLYIGRNIEYDYTGKLTSPFEYCTYRQNDSSGKAIILRSGHSYDDVTFGTMVTEIHDQLFTKSSIKNIQLPKNIKRIGNEAFYKTVAQRRLIIPETCDSIGENAFTSLNDPGTLREIECLASCPPRICATSINGFYAKTNIMVYIPEGKRTLYDDNKYWSSFCIYDPGDTLINVNVKYANSLYGRLAFEEIEPKNVHRLKLSGKLGNDDWNTISEMYALRELDLADVSCEDISAISKIAYRLVKLALPKDVKAINPGSFNNTHISGELIIPVTCDSIGKNAFRETPLTKIVVNGPTSIENGAFAYCDKLSDISIVGRANVQCDAFAHDTAIDSLLLKDVACIEENAFSDCGNIGHITFEGEIDTLKKAFYNCSDIEALTFNGFAKNVAENVFANAKIGELKVNNLADWLKMNFSSASSNPMRSASMVKIEGSANAKLNIPTGITKIGNFAFFGCNVITDAVIMNDVTQLGDSCFSECKRLKSTKLSDNIKDIGKSAFAECDSLSAIRLPNNMNIISSSLLKNCRNLRNIVIPSNATIVYDNAFSGCCSLENIVIPDACDTIGSEAFSGCTSVHDVYLPYSLAHLGTSAFKDCQSLTHINLPYNLSSVNDSVFYGCKNLKEVKALWTTPPTSQTTSFLHISNKCILYVPVGTTSIYYEKGWGRFPLIEEDFCVAYINKNNFGNIKYQGHSYKGRDNAILLETNSDAELEIVPDEDFYIKSIIVDNDTLQPGLHTSTISLKGISANHAISLDYDKYVLGDVNDDNYIDVGDVTSIVRHIQKKENRFFILDAADVNNDNDIDVGDIRSEVNLIYEYAFDSMKRNMAKATTASYDIEMTCVKNGLDEGYTLDVSLDNTDDVAGFQMLLTIPQGMDVQKGSDGNPLVIFDERRTASMGIKSMTQLNDSCFQFLCASIDPTVIKGGKGKVMSVKLVKANGGPNETYNIKLSDIRIADTSGNVFRYHAVSNIIADDINTGIKGTMKIARMPKKYIREGNLIIENNGTIYNVNGTIQTK